MLTETDCYLICGGTSRAGLDLARRLIALGHHCIVAGRHAPLATDDSDATLSEGLMHYESVDFASPPSVEAFCARLKESDKRIVNCLFFQRSRSDDVLEGIQVAVASSAHIVDALAEQLANNQGSVIFIGSILGSMTHIDQTLAYHVAKAALKPLTQYLASQYGPQGIRVNLLSLSTLQHSQNGGTYSQGTPINKIVRELVPLRRAVNVDDLLHSITFLCSPMNKAITGQEIHLDGGLNNLSQVSCVLPYLVEQQNTD